MGAGRRERVEHVSRDSVHLRYRERTTVLIPMTYELA